MKRFAIIILVCLLGLSCCSCSKGSGHTENGNSNNTAVELLPHGAQIAVHELATAPSLPFSYEIENEYDSCIQITDSAFLIVSKLNYYVDDEKTIPSYLPIIAWLEGDKWSAAYLGEGSAMLNQNDITVRTYNIGGEIGALHIMLCGKGILFFGNGNDNRDDSDRLTFSDSLGTKVQAVDLKQITNDPEARWFFASRDQNGRARTSTGSLFTNRNVEKNDLVFLYEESIPDQFEFYSGDLVISTDMIRQGIALLSSYQQSVQSGGASSIDD